MAIEFAGKRVVVMGLGRFGGGLGVSRWLCGQGARVLVTDQADAEALSNSLAALAGLPIETRLGGHDARYLDGCDILVVNPAVDKRRSAFFRAAVARGIPWTSEMNLFLERCRGRLVGVTGSVGKSTTTAMIGAVLEAAARSGRWRHGRVWLGGNIGKSLLDELPAIGERDVVVLELSSFQLEDAAGLGRSPHIAVATNLRENHLDRHGTLAAYAAAKRNLFAFQAAGDWAVLPIHGAEALAAPAQTSAEVVRFAASVHGGVRLIWEDDAGPRAEEVAVALRVPGRHNVENAAAALAVARILGVDDATAVDRLGAFNGLPHRLAFVCEHAGVRYFNDSKATTPAAAMTSLGAFDRNVIAIVGGSDKGTPFDEFGQALAEHAKAVVCIGVTGPAIAKAIHNRGGRLPAIGSARTMDEAVLQAHAQSRSGDVVLLAPGCASFDMFANFEARGAAFVRAVESLRRA